jgi:transcriptional regulator with XRE-family HTH domain
VAKNRVDDFLNTRVRVHCQADGRPVFRTLAMTAVEPQENAWQRVELLRRLERIASETSVRDLCQRVGISRATFYRWFFLERKPGYDKLIALYRAYPKEFRELSILEDKE